MLLGSFLYWKYSFSFFNLVGNEPKQLRAEFVDPRRVREGASHAEEDNPGEAGTALGTRGRVLGRHQAR